MADQPKPTNVATIPPRAEEWRPCPGFAEYEVSNLGRVRKVAGWMGYKKRAKGHQKALRTNSNGRKYVFLTTPDGSDGRPHIVARLVCRAFHGEPPTPEHQVDHINGDSLDDRAENLRWVTGIGNAENRDRLGRTYRGEASPCAKITLEQVHAVRKVYAMRSGNLRDYCRKNGIPYKAAQHACHRTSWRHIP